MQKKPSNFTKVRNYLFNLAHNNIQKLGKKVEDVSVHLIDKHISNEFKKIEDSVAQRIGILLQTLTGTVKKEIANFVNLKIKLALAKSGVLPKKSHQLYVDQDQLPKFQEIPEFQCKRENILKQKNISLPPSKRRCNSLNRLATPKGALAFSSSQIFQQHDGDKSLLNSKLDAEKSVRFQSLQDKKLIENTKREIFGKIGIEMTEISNKVQNLLFNKIDQDIEVKESNIYMFFEKQIKKYLKDIALDMQKRMEGYVRDTVVSVIKTNERDSRGFYNSVDIYQQQDSENIDNMNQELRYQKQRADQQMKAIDDDFRKSQKRYHQTRKRGSNQFGNKNVSKVNSKQNKSKSMPNSKSQRGKKHNFKSQRTGSVKSSKKKVENTKQKIIQEEKQPVQSNQNKSQTDKSPLQAQSSSSSLLQNFELQIIHDAIPQLSSKISSDRGRLVKLENRTVQEVSARDEEEEEDGQNIHSIPSLPKPKISRKSLSPKNLKQQQEIGRLQQQQREQRKQQGNVFNIIDESPIVSASNQNYSLGNIVQDDNDDDGDQEQQQYQEQNSNLSILKDKLQRKLDYHNESIKH